MFVIHFSVDDCIEMFKDITINNYTSIFKSPYFAFLKQLHVCYKAHISLFCFIENSDFSLTKTTDKYVNDFIDNCDWLLFGFHGLNAESRYIDSKENIIKDYKLFAKEIKRITGHEKLCDVLRLHCFSGTKDNLESLAKLGIKGFLVSDDERKSYYLDSNQTHFINTHKSYKDLSNGLCFYKSFLRLESFELDSMNYDYEKTIQSTLDSRSSVMSCIAKQSTDIIDNLESLPLWVGAGLLVHSKNLDSKSDLDSKSETMSQHLMLFTHECHLLNKQMQEKIQKIYDKTTHTHTPNFPHQIHNLELKSFTTDTIKYFFDTYIPITSCNLKCQYCYITQQNLWFNKPPKFNYDKAHIAEALSKERLGGICMFNMCGGGETLLHPYIIDIIEAILFNGHYIWVVTNGTLTSRYQKIAKLQKDLLFRLAFKFSFHYQELKRTNKLMAFVANVKHMQDVGCSFSLEITPHDELIESIDEIKEFSLKHFGALPHITVARDENDSKAILSKYNTKEQYAKIWQSFNSCMFDFKLQLFSEKRHEYCMAGKWTYWLNIGDGTLKQCYSNDKTQNIFINKTKPIKLPAVGVKCKEPFCYNGHAFLTLGAIPCMKTPTYAEIRNRLQQDGREWLNPYMKDFISHKLHENNKKDPLHKRIKGHIYNLLQ